MHDKNIQHHIMIFGTMSAGKSTFINALIGSELLPVGNEATTSVHTVIEHDDRKKLPHAICYANASIRTAQSQKINSEIIRKWSNDPEIEQIHIKTRFMGTRGTTRNWTLHDTPGPNNSQASLHSERAFQALNNISCDTLCYLLNATQIGIQDDQHLLKKIQKILADRPKTRIIFILNKIDCLNPEQGEDITGFLQQTKHYLEQNGFHDHLVIPVMGYLALTAKKQLRGEPLSFKERLFLRFNIEHPPEPINNDSELFYSRKKNKKYIFHANLNKFQPLTNLKNEISILKKLLAISGITIVEEIFHHHY